MTDRPTIEAETSIETEKPKKHRRPKTAQDLVGTASDLSLTASASSASVMSLTTFADSAAAHEHVRTQSTKSKTLSIDAERTKPKSKLHQTVTTSATTTTDDPEAPVVKIKKSKVTTATFVTTNDPTQTAPVVAPKKPKAAMHTPSSSVDPAEVEKPKKKAKSKPVLSTTSAPIRKTESNSSIENPDDDEPDEHKEQKEPKVKKVKKVKPKLPPVNTDTNGTIPEEPQELDASTTVTTVISDVKPEIKIIETSAPDISVASKSLSGSSSSLSSLTPRHGNAAQLGIEIERIQKQILDLEKNMNVHLKTRSATEQLMRHYQKNNDTENIAKAQELVTAESIKIEYTKEILDAQRERLKKLMMGNDAVESDAESVSSASSFMGVNTDIINNRIESIKKKIESETIVKKGLEHMATTLAKSRMMELGKAGSQMSEEAFKSLVHVSQKIAVLNAAVKKYTDMQTSTNDETQLSDKPYCFSPLYNVAPTPTLIDMFKRFSSGVLDTVLLPTPSSPTFPFPISNYSSRSLNSSRSSFSSTPFVSHTNSATLKAKELLKGRLNLKLFSGTGFTKSSSTFLETHVDILVDGQHVAKTSAISRGPIFTWNESFAIVLHDAGEIEFEVVDDNQLRGICFFRLQECMQEWNLTGVINAYFPVEPHGQLHMQLEFVRELTLANVRLSIKSISTLRTQLIERRYQDTKKLLELPVGEHIQSLFKDAHENDSSSFIGVRELDIVLNKPDADPENVYANLLVAFEEQAHPLGGRLAEFTKRFSNYYGEQTTHLMNASKEDVAVVLRKAEKEVKLYCFYSLRVLLEKYPALREGAEWQCSLAIDDSLFSQVYPVFLDLYRLYHTEQDLSLSRQFEKFRDATPENLEIKQRFSLMAQQEEEMEPGYTPPPYEKAIAQLQKITTTYTPSGKATCVSKAMQKIWECIVEFWTARGLTDTVISTNFALGADDMLPIFCYVLIKANLPYLKTQLSIVSDFLNEHLVNGEEGYALATLDLATQYLEKLELK